MLSFVFREKLNSKLQAYIYLFECIEKRHKIVAVYGVAFLLDYDEATRNDNILAVYVFLYVILYCILMNEESVKS